MHPRLANCFLRVFLLITSYKKMVCVEDVGSGFPCNPWGLHIKFLCHTFQSDLYTVRGLKPEYVADGSRKRYKWN